MDTVLMASGGGHASVDGAIAISFADKVITEFPYLKAKSLTCTSDSEPDVSGLRLTASYDHALADYYRLYEGEDHAVLLSHTEYTSYNYYSCQVAGKTLEIRDKMYDRVCSTLRNYEPPVADDTVRVNFWRHSNEGGSRSYQDISCHPWARIQDNYPSGIRKVLDELMEVTPDVIQGKLLLFYGEPGTGKTTLLTSLAGMWRDWTATHYISDPEVFLNAPGYMMKVMLSEGTDKHQLILLEDSGELISRNAKLATGQALSRLLNMTDGMLGSGRKVLIAITTNDQVTELHPAVTRPGRCLVNAEVGAFPEQEAREWLNESTVSVTEPMTLAELYEAKRSTTGRLLGVKAPVVQTGQYL